VAISHQPANALVVMSSAMPAMRDRTS
jgi:hypothetical protein